MERIVQNPVVQDVTTKKKYVKPDFEVIELNMEAPLLTGSGPNTTNGSYGTHFNYGDQNI
ncbi:MAG: hypothetical protein IKO99_10380 [Bacteroidales bacterium]|nr:hypothetical protein [Bacteroidales bacterium]